MEVTLFTPDIIPSDQPCWLPWMSKSFFFLLDINVQVGLSAHWQQCNWDIATGCQTADALMGRKRLNDVRKASKADGIGMTSDCGDAGLCSACSVNLLPAMACSKSRRSVAKVLMKSTSKQALIFEEPRHQQHMTTSG